MTLLKIFEIQIQKKHLQILNRALRDDALMSTGISHREISSTFLFALGYDWRRCPRRRRAAGRQLRMPVVALVRGLYTDERACTHARGDQRLSSSRAVVGHRTRGRSKINGRGAIATGRATVLEDLEDRRRRPRLADRVTAHALCLRCIPQPPSDKTARMSACVRLDLLMPLISTRYSGLESLNS